MHSSMLLIFAESCERGAGVLVDLQNHDYRTWSARRPHHIYIILHFIYHYILCCACGTILLLRRMYLRYGMLHNLNFYP